MVMVVLCMQVSCWWSMHSWRPLQSQLCEGGWDLEVLTNEAKSSSSSLVFSSASSSQAPLMSPLLPYGATLYGGRPTGEPRAATLSVVLCQKFMGSWRPPVRHDCRGKSTDALRDTPAGKRAGSSC